MKKKETSYPILLALTVLLLFLIIVSSTTSAIPFITDSNINATIHGSTYANDTFESLNDTVITINSNPPQTIVAKDGTYSFELKPGDYVITASYYQNSTLLYSKEATIKVEAEGNYVYDLLLYPVPKNSVNGTLECKTNNDSKSPTESTRTDVPANSLLSINTSYITIICALITIFAAIIGSLLGIRK